MGYEQILFEKRGAVGLMTLDPSEADLALVQQREAERLLLAYESPEHRVAVQAFIEKRSPDFRGMRKSSDAE